MDILMHPNPNCVKRRAVFSVGLAVVLVRFLFLAPVFAQEKASQLPPETSRVRIAYTSLSGNMAPLWVAGEKGYFKEYGLTVDQLYTRTVTGIQAVLSGDVQL